MLKPVRSGTTEAHITPQAFPQPMRPLQSNAGVTADYNRRLHEDA